MNNIASNIQHSPDNYRPFMLLFKKPSSCVTSSIKPANKPPSVAILKASNSGRLRIPYEKAIAQYRKTIELAPDNAYFYHNLGLTFSRQARYEEAIEQYKQAIEFYPPENFSAKSDLVLTYLIIERFDTVLTLADEVLNKQETPVRVILEMKLLSTFALFFQGKQVEALAVLQDLITYYSALPEYDPFDWIYGKSNAFISDTDKLSEAEKTLLLTLIDILETPKPQADGKLQELETLLKEWNQEQ